MTYSTHFFRHTRRVIGQNIHSLRFSRRISLRKLSRLSGVPEDKLDQLELGKGVIMLDEMLKIACALKVPAYDLMQGV